MSFIKTAIAAAALTLVAVSANAQSYGYKGQAYAQASYEAKSAPFSRASTEHLTW
jgi:hypothetical protein